MNRISSKVAQVARSTSKFPCWLNRVPVVASMLLLGLSATPSQAAWNVYLEIPGSTPPKPDTIITSDMIFP